MGIFICGTDQPENKTYSENKQNQTKPNQTNFSSQQKMKGKNPFIQNLGSLSGVLHAVSLKPNYAPLQPWICSKYLYFTEISF